MQGIRECIIWHVQTMISNWGKPTTLARRMHLLKSLVNYPCDMDPFVAILRAHRELCAWPFSLLGLCDLKICYKIARVVLVSLAI